MYKEHLAEFWYSAKTLDNSKVSFFVPTSGIYGEVGVNTFRNATGAHYLPHPREYVAPPSINIATGGPTFLGVTSEARANPQLISGMSTFNLNKPIYSASFIIHIESALGDDALAVSTTEADLGKSAPSDFVPQQQDKTHSVSEGLETILTQPTTRKGASFIARYVEEDEASRIINDKDEEADKVHATINIETEDTSVPKSSSPSSLLTQLKDLTSKLNELNEEVKGLKKQVHELEIELPRDLKKIHSNMKTFTSLTSQVAELKTLQ
nr:hypothetical protein [Tanacetum cinerariifolium]